MEFNDRRLRFEREVSPHGADDYESGMGEPYALRALEGERSVGYAHYEDRGDHVRIRHIEVEQAHQRKGIGARLVSEIERLHPNADLTTGGFTPEGSRLNARLGGRIFQERDPLLEEDD